MTLASALTGVFDPTCIVRSDKDQRLPPFDPLADYFP